ncbi:YihY/virulence factor BrkB family protein [Aureimonas populi]|uniref:YihY/virulence factor BrkB family protein n=1 Tax=Aureimonas populi TaxID=1701758 RepID=A0ABW5CKK6_9HYPH|nr:YihY/virulence factor BrkB family protein [Aureimonas populi]
MESSKARLRDTPRQRRTPLWAIAIMGIGTLSRFGRRDSGGEESAEVQDGTSAGSQAARGREAGAPSEMTARGWKDILLRTYSEFNDDRLMLVAAGLTFYVLLAIFPAISALVSIYGIFADPATVSEHLDVLDGVVPGGGMDILAETMSRLAAQGRTTLGFGLVFGLGIALWSANAGMKSLFDALNIVYGETEKRSFVKLTLISLLFTLSTLIFIIVALGAVVVLPVALNFFGLGVVEEWLLLLRWPILLVVVSVGISIIFRYGPSREKAKWRWVNWGSALAALLWVIVSILFSWYVENFGSYDETYGSLGAAVGFMTWIWISSMVILLGAELNAELEHQTAKDTTTEPNQPMGQRGARMADSLGKQTG